MGKIKKLKDVELVGGTEQSDVYPITSTKAIYDENNKRLDSILSELQKSADSSLETENKTIVGSINELKRLRDEGYLFKGVATPDTNPGIVKQKVFYIANGKGAYPNFGGLNVDEDEVVLLIYDDTWKKLATGIASQAKLTELESETIGLHLSSDIHYTSQEVKVAFDKLQIKAGTKFSLTFSSTSSYSELGVFYGSEWSESTRVLLGNAVNGTTYTFTAKEDIESIKAFLISASDYNIIINGQLSIQGRLSPLEEKVRDLESEIEYREQQIAIEKVSEVKTGKFIDVTWGTLNDNESFNVNIYNVAEYVGGTISIPFAYSSGASYTGCLFKGVNGNIISKYLYSEANTFIIPQGAETFWFTANANVSETDILIDFLKRIPINEAVKKIEKQQTYITSYELKKELLEENQVLSLNSAPDIKNNYVLSFYCGLNGMGRLRIVHGDVDYARGNIEIDGTNIYLYDSVLGTSLMSTVAHNLSIDKFLFVQIVEDSTYSHCKIRVSSEGSQFFEIDNGFWNGSERTTYVKAIQGNYNNVYLSLGGDAWNSKTWIFTDSYGDYWPRYVFDLGFKNFLLDGVSGRNSKKAFESLEKELLMGLPSTIVWCLGMNDGDGNVINGDYKEIFDKLKTLCESKGVNLIVTTIPNTPTIRNIYKNEYIRNSGVRYIDIASAVGANEDGSSWREGLLSSDNVHPSDLGARIIASVMMSEIVLNAMVTTLGEGYQFAGVATIDTNPGTPDAKVFYIANGKGTYTNFGSIEVTEDDVVVLYYDTAWHKVSTGIASNSKLTDLEKGVTNIISISKHEDDVKHLIDVSNVTTNGYVDPDSGSIKSASDMYYTSIDVKKGDVVKIKNTVDSVVEYYYMRFIAAFDSNGDVVPSAGVSTATYEYVVPEGVVKLMPTFYKITPKVEIEITRREEVIKSSVNNNTIPYESFTEDTKEMLKTPFVKIKEDVNISTIETIPSAAMSNGYMAPNGVPSPDAQGYKYTSKIGVNAGDIISFQNGLVGGHQDVTPRFICAYDANENPIESRGSSGNIATMVITEDVHFIVVTTYVNENFTGLNILKSSAENKEDQHFQLLRNYGYQYTGELSSGQICAFPLNTLKDEKNIAISSIFTSFNGTLRIGRLQANSAFPYIDINATNVTVVNEFRTLTKAHGLNIDKDLQVFISVKNETLIDKFILVSGGISVDMSNEDWRWFGNYGEPFVQSIGMDISYISVGWSASAFNQDIWICGDSYTSKQSDRWVGYLYEHNLDNRIAVMGYSGSKSPEQYVSLCNLLQIHKPKFVIWCLGMNEEDNNAVNAQWKTYLDAVISLCNLYGINLILATIPCVPSIDNTYKNAIVRASGYRYIDFAKAVNAENAGATWYSGMLSSDNVHPSEKGAKALFYQAISDVPEMLTL